MFIIKTVSNTGVHGFVLIAPLGKQGTVITAEQDRALVFDELVTAQRARDNVLEDVQSANIWRVS